MQEGDAKVEVRVKFLPIDVEFHWDLARTVHRELLVGGKNGLRTSYDRRRSRDAGNFQEVASGNSRTLMILVWMFRVVFVVHPCPPWSDRLRCLDEWIRV